MPWVSDWRYLSLSLATAGTWVALLAPSVAEAQKQETPIEACKIWGATTPGVGEKALDALKGFFGGLFQVKSAPADQAGPADTLYFTTKSLFSSQPRCIRS